MRTKKSTLFKLTLLACLGQLNATTYTWTATTPGSNLDTASNWTPSGPPASGDIANFNSLLPGIDFHPVATTPFSCATMNFLESASPFDFTFTNTFLNFQGGITVGVTGPSRNPAITLTNTNNSLANPQLAFNGTNSSFGSGNIQVTNSSNNTSTNLTNQVIANSFYSYLDSGLVLNVANNSTAISNGIVTSLNAQVNFETVEALDNVTLSLINSGISGDNTSGNTQNIGSQLTGIGIFTAGDYFNLTVSNTGQSGINSSGNNCGAIQNYQSFFSNSLTLGDNGSVVISNSGTNSGTNNNVGTVNPYQLQTLGPFISGNGLNFNVSNSGNNSVNATGTNVVAVVNQSQASFYSFTTGDNSKVSIINSAVNNSGNSTGSFFADLFNNAQFTTTNGPLLAGDNFQMVVMNTGVDGSSGGGNNFVGAVDQQVRLSSLATVGNNAQITVSNSGVSTTSSASSLIGVIGGHQLQVSDFAAGDNFNLTCQNTGSSINAGSNNTIGNVFGDLFLIGGNFSAGDKATITLNNSGDLADGNSVNVGIVNDYELYCSGTFTANDGFTLNATNAGTDTSVGGTNNEVGAVFIDMVHFNNSLFLGDSPTIHISNFGSYSGTDPGTLVGFVGNQFFCNGTFSAGKNLTLIATNTAENPNNLITVGFATNQIVFANFANFKDGTLIQAVNSGRVTGAQINFEQVFNVSGKVTFEALNTGTIGTGINVANSAGGDINVVLQNSSLVVSNTGILTPFTMGALNGDAASSATSTNFGFIIDTDAGVNAAFAGSLNSSFFMKTGPGTQTLSGGVTVSGPSALVNEGVLNITGPFSGSITVRAPGTLTGSSTVSGSLVNDGTVIPNKNLTVTNFTNDGSGILVANVSAQQGNGVLNVTGSTTLNGGALEIGSLDGTYLFYNPYTVLTSGNPISGTFDSVSALSPLINTFITYNTNSIVVNLHQNFSRAAFTPNQMSVAQLLDAQTAPTLAQSLLLSEIANLTIPAASQALDSLSGEQYANEAFFTEMVNRQFIRRLYDPIRFIVACPGCYDPCGGNTEAWFEAGGNFNLIDRSYLNGFQVTGGVHNRLRQNLLLGVAASYEGDIIDYRDHGGWQYRNNGLVGLYALYRPRCFYVLTDLAYGFSLGAMHREIHVGNATYKAKGHLHNHQVTFYGESGVDYCARNVMVQPFVGIEVGSNWRSKVREGGGGGGWALLVHDKNRMAAYTRLGAHFTTCEAIPFRASFDAAWDYRCTAQDNRIVEEFLSFTGDFDISGVKLARSSFDYAFTIEKDITSSWSAYVETTGQIYSRAQTFTVLGGVSLSW